MGRRKGQPTIDEARTLREQLQDYIRDLIEEFEAASGITVKWIEIQHVRKPGFGEKDHLKINIETEL